MEMSIFDRFRDILDDFEAAVSASSDEALVMLDAFEDKDINNTITEASATMSTNISQAFKAAQLRLDDLVRNEVTPEQLLFVALSAYGGVTNVRHMPREAQEKFMKELWARAREIA